MDIGFDNSRMLRPNIVRIPATINEDLEQYITCLILSYSFAVQSVVERKMHTRTWICDTI